MFLACFIASLLFIVVQGAPVDFEAGVANCDDVIQLYTTIGGFVVTDCYEDTVNSRVVWRIDTPLEFTLARTACKAAQNADIAVVTNFQDQHVLNALYMAKVTLNTWMWIGIARQNGALLWVDGSPVPDSRWYRFNHAKNNGDCAVQLMLTDDNGDADGAGTYYYTENCKNKYITACQATIGTSTAAPPSTKAP